MSRTPLALVLTVRRSTYAAIAILALTAACDRETPTDLSRPVATQASLVKAPTLAVSSRPSVSGYEVKTFGIDVASGNSGVVEVLCPLGKQALGGGFQIGGGVLISGPEVAVYESSPRPTSGPAGSSGWRLEAVNRGSDAPRRFDVWVICALV
jgi:hypothetical protein